MRKSRVSKVKQARLVAHFVTGTTARCVAALVRVNAKTAVYYFHRLREMVACQFEQQSETVFSGEIEVEKVILWCLEGQERSWSSRGNPCIRAVEARRQVCTKVIADASSATLYPIIERKVVPDSIVYSDCWRGSNVLDISDFRHFRINHSRRFAERQNYISGIENFWNQAKRHWRRFNGVPRSHFPLFLKACEWCFNNPNPQEQ